MSRETAKYVVEQLEKTYSRKFPKAGIEKIWPDLLKENPKAMEAAFDYFALNSAFLPSPALLLSRVQGEGRVIRQKATLAAESAEKAKEIPSDGNALERAARDEHAKLALQGLTLIRRNDKTWDEKLEFFKLMDTRYPNFGWALAGMELKKHLDKDAKREHWRDVAEASPVFQQSYRQERERQALKEEG